MAVHQSVSPAALQGLSEQAQCLFLRFFLRKGPWFRLSTAQYSELSDAAAAAAELEAASFAAVTASTTDPELLMELGQTLTVAELQQLLGGLHLLGRGNKGQLLKQLGKACREGGPASEVRATSQSRCRSSQPSQPRPAQPERRLASPHRPSGTPWPLRHLQS